ncbi:MAG: site-specific integrase [Acidobacteria bacterium]|nr:MAG: site-specific integrase [Acidobacteriota bacterium]
MRGDGRIYRRQDRAGTVLPHWYLAWWGFRDGRWQELREATTETDETKARKLLANRVRSARNHRDGITGPTPSRRLTINDLLDSLLKDAEQRELKGLRELRCHAKPVRDYFGPMRASTITTDTIRHYITQRQRATRVRKGVTLVGRANATINRETEILRRAYRLAQHEGRVATVPHVPRLREDNARQGFFEPNEITRLLPHLQEPLRAMTRLAYLTGWRLGEIRTLRWEHVDHHAHELHLSDTKNGDGRRLPLDDHDWTLIQEQWTKRQYTTAYGTTAVSPYVFHRLGQPMREDLVERWWHKATTKAGLQGRLFHDLRRTAIRDMIRAGVPQSVAMSISGHRTDSMFRRYDIVSANDKTAALQRRREHAHTGGLVAALPTR